MRKESIEGISQRQSVTDHRILKSLTCGETESKSRTASIGLKEKLKGS